MAQRVRDIQLLSLPWLVAAAGEKILGFAYGGKWKVRAAYRHSSEITVYVRPGQESETSRLRAALAQTPCTAISLLEICGIGPHGRPSHGTPDGRPSMAT